jgi:hypothetical protein
MKPPWAYREARRRAPIHAQMYVSRPASNAPGKIAGRIVRIFRDKTGTLYPGKHVQFFIPVMDDEPGPISPGGTIYHDWDRFASARWVEMFLEPNGPGYHLVDSQIAPIRRPTFRPICGPEVEGFCF